MKAKFCAGVTAAVASAAVFIGLWALLWPVGPTTNGWEAFGRFTVAVIVLAGWGIVLWVVDDVWSGKTA